MLQIMTNYIALIPNEFGSLIIEIDGQQKQQSETPLQYLKNRCLIHGSSLEGREESYRYLTHYVQKCPILVNESPELWFPTLSRNNKECMWVNWFYVIDAKDDGNNGCIVIFDSGIEVKLNCSIRSFRLQMSRCYEFLQKLHNN